MREEHSADGAWVSSGTYTFGGLRRRRLGFTRHVLFCCAGGTHCTWRMISCKKTSGIELGRVPERDSG
jgi:hypothetical protein